MIRMTKYCLKKLVGRAKLFITLLKELSILDAYFTCHLMTPKNCWHLPIYCVTSLYCSCYITGIETYPYLTLQGSASKPYMHRVGKIHSSRSERELLLHSWFCRWRGSRSHYGSPFKPFANSTLVDALLPHESSTFHDPKVGSNFGKCFFYTIVENLSVHVSRQGWLDGVAGVARWGGVSYIVHAFDRRPLHLQAPSLSRKRPNCPFNLSKWDSRQRYVYLSSSNP